MGTRIGNSRGMLGWSSLLTLSSLRVDHKCVCCKKKKPCFYIIQNMPFPPLPYKTLHLFKPLPHMGLKFDQASFNNPSNLVLFHPLDPRQFLDAESVPPPPSPAPHPVLLVVPRNVL